MQSYAELSDSPKNENSMPCDEEAKFHHKRIYVSDSSVRTTCYCFFVGRAYEKNQKADNHPVAAEMPVTHAKEPLLPSWIDSITDQLEAHVAATPVDYSPENELVWMSDFRSRFIRQVNANQPELVDSDFVAKSDYVYKKLLLTRYQNYTGQHLQGLFPWKQFLQYADWLNLKDECRTVASKKSLQDEMHAWHTLCHHLVEYAYSCRLHGQEKPVKVADNGITTSSDKKDSLAMTIEKLNCCLSEVHC